MTTITLRLHQPFLERVARGEAELTKSEQGHVVRELLALRAKEA